MTQWHPNIFQILNTLSMSMNEGKFSDIRKVKKKWIEKPRTKLQDIDNVSIEWK